MPNINLDDAYILDETGAQVDKVTGLFTKDEDTTSGEKAFAQLNIGTAGSNRNLLDNPWFTVNQRSATTVTLNGTEAYIADRWIAGSFGTYTHNSDNTITITCPNDTTYAGLTQRIDPVYKGGTYTYSVRLSDDTVISLQGTMPSGSGLNIYNININGTAWQVLFRSDGSAYWVTLRCNVANTTITIKAVKLEPGSVSTLANDAPPDYGEELAKCQRYFWRLGNTRFLNICPSAMAEASGACFGICHLPVPMRAMPTISVKGSPVAWTGDGSAMSTTSVTVVRNDSASPTVNPTFVGIRANGGDFTIGRRYDIQIRDDATAYVDFSADL